MRERWCVLEKRRPKKKQSESSVQAHPSHKNPLESQPTRYPECSTTLVTNLPPLITVFNCSGTALSSNTPSSSPSTGSETLMLELLAVTISTSKLSFER